MNLLRQSLKLFSSFLTGTLLLLSATGGLQAQTTVSTLGPSGLTMYSVTVGGIVSSTDPVTERGIRLFSINGFPNMNFDVPMGSGTGAFSQTLGPGYFFMPGVRYRYVAYALTAAGRTEAPIDYSFLLPDQPFINVATSSNATTSSVQLNASVSFGSPDYHQTWPVVEWGFLWSTVAAGVNEVTGTRVVTGTGSLPASVATYQADYDSVLTGLPAGTTIYWRAYARNAVTTGYSLTESAQTLGNPAVTTGTPAANITANRADLSGSVTPYPGFPVTAWGFEWNITNPPSPGGTMVSATTGSGFTGSFGGTVTGMPAGAVIYYQAFAITGIGKVYGSVQSLTTLPPQRPSVTSVSHTSVQATSAVLTGNLTADNGAPVTDRGFVWARFSFTTPGTAAQGYNYVPLGGVPLGSTGAFGGSSPTSPLPAGTIIWWRAYATNSVGTSYGIVRNFTTTSLAPVTTSAAAGGAIPASTAPPLDIPIAVSGLNGVVKDVTLSVTLTHPNAGNLHMELIAPAGGPVHEVFDITSTRFLSGAYVFNDGAADTATNAPFTPGQPIPPDTYLTENTAGITFLNTTFGGRNPNGTWILRVRNTAGTAAGNVSAASLTLATAQPGTPSFGGTGTICLAGADSNTTYELQCSTDLFATYSVLASDTTGNSGTLCFIAVPTTKSLGQFRLIPRP